MTTHKARNIKTYRGWNGRANFSAWARTVIQVGRAQGHSDKEIWQWMKVYAKKGKIPRGKIAQALSANGVHIRPGWPYKIRASSRAALHQKNTIPPRIRYLMDEINDGIMKWQLSILRTLKEAKEQGEDLEQTKREIMDPIKRDWDSHAFSKLISLEEFIKRVVPELHSANLN